MVFRRLGLRTTSIFIGGRMVGGGADTVKTAGRCP
jgi:hypothetical protein